MADRLRRISKELGEFGKDGRSGNIKVSVIDDSVYHLKAVFPGPEETPYQGGIFEVDVYIPDVYPFQPPAPRFTTKVYHPNVSSDTGAICLDTLAAGWSPRLTIKHVLMALQSLLHWPEPKDPQDAEVAKQYLTDKATFEKIAAYWTHIYAGGPAVPPPPGYGATNTVEHADEAGAAGLEKSDVERIEQLGFSRHAVIDVLQRLDYRGANRANISDEDIIEELLQTV